MKKNRVTLWIFVLFVFSFGATATLRAEVKPVDPSKAKDIRKLIHLIRLEEVVMMAAETTLDRFFPILKEATAQNNQAVSETVYAILKGSTMALVKRQISAEGGLVDRVIPLYDKHYTHGEIQELIRFYETPLGQKVCALRPRIAKEGMAVAEDWIRFLEPLLVQALARGLEKEGYVIVKNPAK